MATSLRFDKFGAICDWSAIGRKLQLPGQIQNGQIDDEKGKDGQIDDEKPKKDKLIVKKKWTN